MSRSASLQQIVGSNDFLFNSINPHSNFATILPHLVVAIAPVSLDLLAADILSNYGHSSKLYLFDHDDAANIQNKFPVLHNAFFVFDKDHPPSLASICMLVLPIVKEASISFLRAGLLLMLLHFWPRVPAIRLYCVAQTVSVAAALWQLLCFFSSADLLSQQIWMMFMFPR
jgi:hypothetical protein